MSLSPQHHQTFASLSIGRWPASVKLGSGLSCCGQARMRREPPYYHGSLGGRREPALQNGEGLGPSQSRCMPAGLVWRRLP